MKQLKWGLSGAAFSVLFAGAVLMAQGGIGPIGMLPGRVDSNNALVVTAVAAGTTGTQGSPIANLPGKVDASNNLVVTFGSGAQIPGPIGATCVTPGYSFTGDTDSGLGWLAANNIGLCVGGATVLSLSANIVDQVNGTSAQVERIYNTYSSAGANFERLEVGWAANVATITNTAGGTGANRNMAIGTSGASNGTLFLRADGTNRWQVTTSTGHFLPVASNTYDLCASGTTCRTGYFGTSVVSPVVQGSGTGVTVANVGANSCGTTAATIDGNQVSGKITVGATAATQCRVTFSTAAPVSRDCTVTDETTTIATRATYVSTTTHDFLGAFVAGDLVTYICTVR